jgi:deoxyribodipyrimidine photo-lyase
MTKQQISIFWFRRDLRLEDNAALYQALKSDFVVLPIFIFDREILDKLTNKKDARVLFIHQEILAIKKRLEKINSSLLIFHGSPIEVFKNLTKNYSIKEVYANRDYEPYAQKRDQEIYQFLTSQNIEFKGKKDQVIFEKNEILKDDQKPYTVFTPYSKKWKSKISDYFLKSYPCEKYFSNFLKCSPFKDLSLEEIGFENFDFIFPNREIDLEIIKRYAENRDFPGVKGTSKISLHLRFGTISVRKVAQIASKISEKFFNEIIWRDFYQMILYHFPHTENKAFKAQYDNIKWLNNIDDYNKWCEGKTGYPIVDAAMRELNSTGFMHNRSRMIVASFLTKHLLIDWRWGERYFAAKLLDYDMASNIGGWQWAAGCGCDAAPYFRIFNPESQAEKFDNDLVYIKKYLPEINTDKYPDPIVDHKFARERCLKVFKNALTGL